MVSPADHAIQPRGGNLSEPTSFFTKEPVGDAQSPRHSAAVPDRVCKHSYQVWPAVSETPATGETHAAKIAHVAHLTGIAAR